MPALTCRLASVVLLGGLAACGDANGPGSGLAASTLGDWPPVASTPVEGGVAGAYLAGRRALAAGDIRTAADRLEAALRADPDNLDLRRQVFTLKLASGQTEAALALAEELAVIDREADEARLLLAFAALKADDHATTLARLDEVRSRGIAGMALPMLQAWALFGAGEGDRALTVLESAETGDGLDEVRRYHRAAMLALAGEEAEAAELLRGIIERDPRAPTRLVRGLAAIEYRRGEVEAARRLLEEAHAETRSDVAIAAALAEVAAGKPPALPITDAATGMADALLSLARALAEQRAAAQGLLYGRLAGYLAPEHYDIPILLGEILLQQDNPEEAVRVLTEVPAESPHGWEARMLRAHALREQDRLDEALALLEAMADERPERIDPLVDMGDFLRREERYAEAEAAYSRAIERVDEVTPAHWRLFYVRGIAYERTDRWDEAETDLSRALELEPEQPFVLNYLGYSWVDQGTNLEKALGMLERAVELRPEDGFIVDSLGWAHYRLGNMEEAVRHLERAVELEPSDPVINDHLGDAYWRVGRKREARFQWERALVFEPEEDVVADIERKLREGLGENDPERG